MPKVSVIIPVYNVEAYLRKCLDSVVNQTLKDIEIICVDDGSTDGSAAILEEYAAKDVRIKIIKQENAGVNVARKEGLKLATGEWITFCDADDWIEPDAIEKMVAAAQREDADCVCCGMLRDWRNGTSVFRPFDEMGPSDTYNAVVNKLFKRNLLENLMMDESVSLGEDLMVSAQAMAKAKKIAVLEKGFYHYCENSSLMTHVQNGRKRVENLARVGEILRKAMPESRYDDFHDRVTRDAMLLWIRHRVGDRNLWRELRTRLKGGLLSDPRHGLIKKGALACAACIFD